MFNMDYKKYQSIPNCLRQYRKERGLRQNQVATALGLKNKTLISRWEHGDALPNLVSLIRLSIIYRVKMDELFIDLKQEISKEVFE